MKRINEILSNSLPENISRTLSLVKLWGEVGGDFLARYSTPLFLKDGVLYIGTWEHILKNEFFFLKDDIINKLRNNNIDVKDIKIIMLHKENRRKDKEILLKEPTDKEKMIVERLASKINNEELREKFRNAMLAYFKRYSYKDFLKNDF
ncbi:DciA family protein [Deferribacter thermophilus]|uniref:hypothetical protein n=1 Tax=Deferribacter thermophilus TaxID=53573 RepID=UPI003C203908